MALRQTTEPTDQPGLADEQVVSGHGDQGSAPEEVGRDPVLAFRSLGAEVEHVVKEPIGADAYGVAAQPVDTTALLELPIPFGHGLRFARLGVPPQNLEESPGGYGLRADGEPRGPEGPAEGRPLGPGRALPP